LARQQLHLDVSEAARQEIANRGYDPTYGARPLKRVIQQELQNPLATELLKNAYPEGSTVAIDYDGTDFEFHLGKSASVDKPPLVSTA
jgi:ATP-dependent Clp protease ATP-binding subunit ClpB